MPYQITDYSRQRAKELGVSIKTASNPKKKIDVYKSGVKVATIGDSRYRDYPTYLKEEGKAFADSRRKLYKQRHKSDLLSGNGYWANRILW